MIRRRINHRLDVKTLKNTNATQVRSSVSDLDLLFELSVESLCT